MDTVIVYSDLDQGAAQRVALFLQEYANGFCYADEQGLETPWPNNDTKQLSILYTDSSAKPRTWLFGCIQFPLEPVCVGTLYFRNSTRDPHGTSWVFEMHEHPQHVIAHTEKMLETLLAEHKVPLIALRANAAAQRRGVRAKNRHIVNELYN